MADKKSEKEASKPADELEKELPTAEETGEVSPAESAPAEEQAPSKSEEGEPSDDELIADLSPRAQKRFRALAQKASKADELQQKVDKYEKGEPQGEVIDEMWGPEAEAEAAPEEAEAGEAAAPEVPAPARQPLPWETEEARETGVPVEQLRQQWQQDFQAFYEAQRTAERRVEKFEADVAVIEEKWPQFNPDLPDKYDEKLVDFVRRSYTGAIRKYPNLRILDYVTQLMDILGKKEAEGKAALTTEVAKQAAEQAPAPAGEATRAGLTPEDLKKMGSAEEMERVLPAVTE